MSVYGDFLVIIHLIVVSITFEYFSISLTFIYSIIIFVVIDTKYK